MALSLSECDAMIRRKRGRTCLDGRSCYGSGEYMAVHGM
jgi:hypothetical protein